MNLNETIYPANHMINVDEIRVADNIPMRNITLLALLDETNCLTNNDGTRIPQTEIDEISNIAVVWGYVETNPRLQYGEIVVQQIYNHDTGEVYWEDFENRVDDAWTDNDETLVNSLLMWGELEQTIDGGY